MANTRDKIRFVLVKPRSPGNIGSAARALKNFGFSDLAVVDPRLHSVRNVEGEEPFYQKESRKMAWNAVDLLEKAKIAGSLDEAIGDCSLVVGTDPSPSARFEVVTPEEAAARIAASPGRRAVLFGTESYGLTQKELSKCNCVIRIPTDDQYRDLNLSQSLVVIAYLLFRELQGHRKEPKGPEPAPQFMAEALSEDFLEIAIKSGFLKYPDSKTALELSHLVRNFPLSERSAGMLRSLAKSIKAKLK